MHNSEVLEKVRRLHEEFEKGEIPRLAEHEVHPNLGLGSRANYLYFTLPCAINFQRSSPAMWQAALKTWNDLETNYVFFPQKAAQEQFEKLQKDLLKHKLAVQTNKHPTIWYTISSALHSLFQDDPRELLRKGGHDVENVLSLVQSEYKSYFPYLSGAKLANYWLYILSQFTDVKLKNMYAISIIPDTHVVKSSVQLGLVPETAKPEVVAMAWKQLLKDTDISPVDIHPVLWNWSRNNFKPEV